VAEWLLRLSLPVDRGPGLEPEPEPEPKLSQPELESETEGRQYPQLACRHHDARLALQRQAMQLLKQPT
jgi:hypothetical protein